MLPAIVCCDWSHSAGLPYGVARSAAIAAERTRLRIYTPDKSVWSFPAQVAEKLGWKKAFELREPLAPAQ